MTASVTHLGLRIILVLFVIGCGVASARWKPEFADNSPAVQKWFQEQTNENGISCCASSDGHRFDGDYQFNPDGSVTAHENGYEYMIEKNKILKGGNPTNSAVWFYIGDGAARTSYCFSPGTLS